MKFFLPAVLVFCLCTCFACSTKKHETGLSIEEEADVVRASLRVVGIKSEVLVRDVDNNGITDFYIVAVNLSRKPSPERKHLLFVYVTGLIGSLSESVRQESDRVYLEIIDEVYTATVEDCFKCANIGRAEIDECIDTIWQEAE